MVSTRSVAVDSLRSSPCSLKPDDRGASACVMGWPSMAASASMPPTPQPSTPSPFTIGVWESVPTSVSGYAMPSSALKTTRARYSRLTWWQMPVSGRHHPEPVEGLLTPPQELVALAVAVELHPALNVERVGGSEPVDDHRVVDHQLRRDMRVDPGRVAAQGLDARHAWRPGRPRRARR